MNNGKQEWRIASWDDNSLKFVKITGTTFTPFTINNNSFQDALVLAASGVGIGTSAPSEKLEVNGRIKAAAFIGDGSLITILTIGQWFTNTKGIYYDKGYVGIGTTTPGYTLDVKGKAIKLGLEGNGGGQLVLTNNANDNKIYLEAFNKTGDGNADELLLTGIYSKNVPKLSLLADSTYIAGNVGIGTTTPPQKLSISGQESSAHGVGAGIGISNIAPGGTNWYLRVGATGTATPASGFSLGDDIAYRLVIDKSGNVGIGTKTPEKLHL